MRKIIAAVLILAAPGACTGGGSPKASETPTTSPTPSPSSAPATPTSMSKAPPTRFIVIDSTWVSADRGWVLGKGTCGGAECVSLRATGDGGRTWRTVTAPGGTPPAALKEDCQDPCVGSVRFANATVGYAFGPGFYVTRDGAKTWRREDAPLVLNLEISRGRAYRVVARMLGCPGPCDVRIEVSDVASRTWRRLPSPHRDFVGTGLAIQGRNVFLAGYANTAGGAENAHTEFLRSLDGGSSWRSLPDPCGSGPDGENDTTAFASTPGGVLSVVCKSRMSPQTRQFVMTSRDAGFSFGPRRALPRVSAEAISLATQSTIAVAVLRANRSEVLVSRDGGRTWRMTLSVPGGEVDTRFFLGFQNATTARAAFSGRSIWTTRDAGRTWTRSNPF
ncbi:MAG: hypothetical protein WAT66_12160 [Actinomycetota bacterium]